MKPTLTTFFTTSILLIVSFVFGQNENTTYKKRVLESAEIETIFSFYQQAGNNAAVTGGLGTEALTNGTSSVIITMPLNDDDILTIDTGLSAYSSASNSNVNPFDGNQNANPFVASSGASQSEVLGYFSPEYRHASEDRKTMWGVKGYLSAEYDYYSIGVGANVSYEFNEQNTVVAASAMSYLDTWNPQYPIELRPNSGFIGTIQGYNPEFSPFKNEKRTSSSLNLSLSQILTPRINFSLETDLVWQQGLLSSPLQRVYFQDAQDIFRQDFQLADDVERLPDNRIKLPVGARLNYYLNNLIILRGYYRYYWDTWGISGHTLQIESPLKVSDKFTLYPNLRYYTQTAADYFAPNNQLQSNALFYTSDFDLSAYNALQYGIGISYKDVLTQTKLLFLGLKSIYLRYAYYDRNNGFSSYIFTFGTSFVVE